jgi:hypothetical protein
MSDEQKRYLYGLVAEFGDGESLKAAVKAVRAAGYQAVRAHTPYRVEGLGEILGHRGGALSWLVLGALVAGAVAGYAMQYYTDVIAYPVNVAGRPLNSWPAFVIICFELAILFAGLTAFGGMLLLSGLPLPFHPVFNTPDFDLASGERFYLCIEARDHHFDREGTRQLLERLGPRSVNEVEV